MIKIEEEKWFINKYLSILDIYFIFVTIFICLLIVFLNIKKHILILL